MKIADRGEESDLPNMGMTANRVLQNAGSYPCMELRSRLCGLREEKPALGRGYPFCAGFPGGGVLADSRMACREDRHESCRRIRPFLWRRNSGPNAGRGFTHQGCAEYGRHIVRPIHTRERVRSSIYADECKAEHRLRMVRAIAGSDHCVLRQNPSAL